MLDLGHKKLDVWKLGIKLVKDIYQLTDSFPVTERYGITSQLRRAALSIPTNIAEGSSRSSAKERKRFYEISRGSLVEVDSLLEVCTELHYCNRSELLDISTLNNELFAKLSKLIEKTIY